MFGMKFPNERKLRERVLSLIETYLFKAIQTFVLLNFYKKHIDDKIGSNKISVLNARFLEGITTTYINGYMNKSELSVFKRGNSPTVLLHGNWGPQKDLGMGLRVLDQLKHEGKEFKLIISGGTNHHFPKFTKQLEKLFDKYAHLINKNLGAVQEASLIDLFLQADLLILPYITPGGHSGVLEQAIFFEVPTISIDFPEYREQVDGLKNVTLTNPGDLYNSVLNSLLVKSEGVINISGKIAEVSHNMHTIIEGVCLT